MYYNTMISHLIIIYFLSGYAVQFFIYRLIFIYVDWTAKYENKCFFFSRNKYIKFQVQSPVPNKDKSEVRSHVLNPKSECDFKT